MNNLAHSPLHRIVSVLLAIACFLAGMGSAIGQVTITGLGTLGGPDPFSTATAVNNSGMVVGESSFSAFSYSGGAMTNLGNLGGSRSRATNVNDSGQIVGDSVLAGGLTQPFLYTNGVMTGLGQPSQLPFQSSGINNAGQVVGFRELPGFEIRGFLYSNGNMQDLGVFGMSFVRGINNLGQVVGDHTSGQGAIYQNGSVTTLGTLGGAYNSPFAINDLGQVAGLIDFGGNVGWRAYRYSNGAITNLGTLPGDQGSIALGINNSGQVVGYSSSSNFTTRAFLYDGGSMIDLNTLIDPASGWVLHDARDINDFGQIVGTGTRNGVFFESYLLTLGVPEPSSVLLMGAICLGWLGVCRRR